MAFTDKDRERLTEVHTILKKNVIPHISDHEARMRKVETRQIWGGGAWAAVTTIFGGLFAIFK